MSKKLLPPAQDLFQVGGYTPTQLTDFDYKPVYAGQPLEAQRFVGEKMVEVYNKNVADLSAIDILNGQRKAIDGDNEINNKISEEYKNQLAEVAKSGDYENMTMRVNALARQYHTDPRIRAMQESRMNWDKEQAMAQEIRMKTGKDPLFMGSAGSHKTVSTDENGKPVYNIYRSSAEAPLDWQEKRQNIWSVIQPNMGQLSKEQIRKTLQEIPGYLATGTWRGIGDAKIKNLLDEAVSAYQSTPEYRQEVKYLESLGDENADQTVKTRVLKEGLLKTFSQTDPQYMRDWILEDQMQAAKTPQVPSIPFIEAMPAIKLKTELGFEAGDFEIKDRPEGANVSYGIPGASLPGSAATTYKGERKGITETERQAFNEAAMAGMEVFYGPELAKQAAEMGSDFYKSPQAVEAAKKYQEFVTTRYNFPTAQPWQNEEMQKAATNQVRQFLWSRVAYDIESDTVIPTGEGGQLNSEFAKLIGGKVTNLTSAGFVNPKNGFGRLTKDSRFGDAEIVNVQVDGNVKQLLISKPKGYYATGEGRYKQALNTLWSELALNPGKIKNFNLEGMEVQAKAIPDINDPTGENEVIMVYKAGVNDYSDNPVPVKTYDALLNALIALNK
jgi:hypothetical protein